MGVFRSSMKGCERFARPGDDRLPELRRTRNGRRERRPTVPDYAPSLSERELQLLMGDEEMSKSGIQEILSVSRREGSSLTSSPEALVTFMPREASLQPKEVSAAQFSNKLFMMHGNLRVLEQKMLTHDGLQVDTKFDLVERICRSKAAILALGQPLRKKGDQVERAATVIREIEWNALVNEKPSVGEKWRSGQVDYPDGTSESVEEFFHRLCVARDGLMTLEAIIEDRFGADRSELQNFLAYVRRCYGTLKTFNVLFNDRRHYFTT